MKRAESQRALLALQLTPSLPGPGTYKVVSVIDDSEEDPPRRRETLFYCDKRPTQAVG
jgi:hypothetical protein